MNDTEPIQRSRIARLVYDLWGQERSEANAGLIESASLALARIEELRPDATAQLDSTEEAARG